MKILKMEENTATVRLSKEEAETLEMLNRIFKKEEAKASDPTAAA